MASILFNIARISNSQFKYNYLKNEKLFLHFLFHFRNLPQILNILKKKMMLIANVFPNFQTVKNLVTPLYKKRPFRNTLRKSTFASVPNTCEISMRPLLSIFFIIFGEVHLENISSSVR